MDKSGTFIIRLSQVLKKIDEKLFPQIEIYSRKIPPLNQVGIFLFFALGLSGIGLIVPADGFVGYDWVNFFSRKMLPRFYSPWLAIILNVLNWPILIGVTLSAVGLAIYKRSVNVLSFLFAFMTLPVIWTVFLGQIEGLLILGLLGLPWLTPLALIKTQVSSFAFLAKRSYVIAMVVFLLLSFIVWGFWPKDMVGVLDFYNGRENDVALKGFGIPVGLLLMWFSRGDMDMLMVAGSFATLHLHPFNLLPVIPAVARLRPGRAAIACILSWLPLSANWLGPTGWWLTWLFVIWLWVNLAINRYDVDIITLLRLIKRKAWIKN